MKVIWHCDLLILNVPDEGYLALLPFDIERTGTFNIKRLQCQITFIKYVQNQNVAMTNNLHQVRSISKGRNAK
jgi:hypothetical protein